MSENGKSKRRERVYVILRHRGSRDANTNSLTGVVIHEVVRSMEIATAEIKRLNAKHAEKGDRFTFCPSRLYPDGMSAGGSHGEGEHPS
jgi:hypothetical protein